jgi:hypothetical protein
VDDPAHTPAAARHHDRRRSGRDPAGARREQCLRLELPSLGERERLDEGKLHLYSPGADPPERVGERFVVAAAAGRLEAAVDGEPDLLETPVEFRVELRALRVLVPPAESG